MKKGFTRVITLALAVLMILSLCTTAFAATGSNIVVPLAPEARANNDTVPVFVDTMRNVGGREFASDHSNYTSKIASVTLGGKNVANYDSGSNSQPTRNNPQGGASLNSYFGTGAGNGPLDLVITPQEGYYVKQLVVVCYWRGYTGNPRPENPYDVCSVWNDGTQTTKTFNIATGGAAKTTLIKGDFTKHNPNPYGYYILVEVLPVPTPLYVEYNYGNISDFVTDPADSAFNTTSGWTTVDSRNVYGTGEIHTNPILTANTQFAYQYPTGHSEQVTDWAHFANSITPAALEEAANAGYYFAGWDATYYSAHNVTSGGANGNNYDLGLNTYYGNGHFGSGAEVPLSTNVRLTAVWKPIRLNVEKTVSGLPTGYNASRSYTFDIFKNGNPEVWHTLAVNVNIVNGVGTVTSDPINKPVFPGDTFNLVETGDFTPIDFGGKRYNCAFNGSEIKIDLAQVLAGKGLWTLTGTNTYSDKPLTTNIPVTKIWKDEGNAYNTRPEFITVQLWAGDTMVAEQTVAADEAGDWKHIFENVPIYVDGTMTEIEYTIKEIPVPGYEAPVYGGDKTDFTVTNSLAPVNVTVTKNVIGTWAEFDKDFAFTYSIEKPEGEVVKTGTFTLKHGASEILEGVQLGSKITITEASGDYTATCKVGEADVVGAKNTETKTTTFVVTVDDTDAITVTNERNGTPPTGVVLDTLPYVVILALVVVGGMLLLKRKKHDD